MRQTMRIPRKETYYLDFLQLQTSRNGIPHVPLGITPEEYE